MRSRKSLPMWLHHPGGKIAVWVPDAPKVNDAPPAVEEKPKKTKKK